MDDLLNPDAELIEVLSPQAIAEVIMPMAFIIERRLYSLYIPDSAQEFPVSPY